MGDLISPIIMLAVTGNIFFTESVKRRFVKMPSFVVSIIGGLIGAFGTSNLDILKILPSVQSFVLNAFVIISASWGLYTWVLSRFITKPTTIAEVTNVTAPTQTTGK